MKQCMDADNLHRRLKKIIGQVQAIDRMIDEDIPCEDVLAQINAAKSALHGCGKVVLEGVIAMARACLENDIPVGLGTDTGCPYVTHYDMWRELCYFVKYCGVTPAFALHSATLLNARLAGIDSVTGSVEAGKAADLIVCDRDPLADLTALRSLHMVIKDGVRIDHPVVRKMPEVERELDKFL